MKIFASALCLLLLLPALSYAQAWSGAEQATVDALTWVQWNQWVQNGLLVGLIIVSSARK